MCIDITVWAEVIQNSCIAQAKSALNFPHSSHNFFGDLKKNEITVYPTT